MFGQVSFKIRKPIPVDVIINHAANIAAVFVGIIDVVIDERVNVVAVPIAAVLKSGSKNYVRVITDSGRIKRVLIEVGLTQDEFIEVTKGLTGKELVVVSVTTPTE